ncbi:hypothetical protein [Laspinema palackyanum]|nr:hypothetical protein [Laspinema sp. D2c]
MLDPVNPDSEGPIEIPASLREKLQGSTPKDSSLDEIKTPEELQLEDF